MTEKLKPDLSLVLPDVLDERRTCMGRLTGLLQAEGLEKAYMVNEDGNARPCLHYDPQQFSVSGVRELSQAAGARIGSRYRHESLRSRRFDIDTFMIAVATLAGKLPAKVTFNLK